MFLSGKIMKINKKQILKYIEEGILKLIYESKNNPYIFMYEADLQAQLYMTLYNYRNIFRELYYDKHNKIKTNLLHLEYPYSPKNLRIKHDLVVLDLNKLSSNREWWEKHILAGIEVKICEYGTEKNILELIEWAASVFKSKYSDNYAEYGYVVYYEMSGFKTKKEIKSLKEKIIKLKERRNLNRVTFYYFHLNEKTKELETVKV
jgi:hypothetical protein